MNRNFNLIIALMMKGLFIALFFQSCSNKHSDFDNATTLHWKNFNDLKLEDADGYVTKLSELGEKRGMLLLYNPECESCVIKLYELRDLASDLKDWTVVLIASQIRRDKTKVLLEKLGFNQWDHIDALFVNQQELMALHHVESVPQLLIFNMDGNLEKILPENEINFEQIIEEFKN
jgi:thioredoxin-related protein